MTSNEDPSNDQQIDPGDPEVIAELRLIVKSALKRYPWQYPPPVEIWVDDITQDVLLKLVSAGPPWKEVANRAAYLRQVVKYRMIDAWKKNPENRDVAIEGLEFPSHAADPFEMVSVRETAATLQEIFSELGEEDRRLFEMRIVHGYNYRQMAELTGEKENYLRVKFSRLIQRLSRELYRSEKK